MIFGLLSSNEVGELIYFVFQPNFFPANIIILGAVKDRIKAHSAVNRTAALKKLEKLSRC